jgi:hypothetical protein
LEGFDVSVGTYWRKSLLGTDAVYRVISVDSDAVVAEVHDVPGLEAGTQIRFAPDAFLRMVEIDAPTEQPGSAA